MSIPGDLMKNTTMEETPMASKNHSIVQARLTAYLMTLEKYAAATELSLDMASQDRMDCLKRHGFDAVRELKPDVALYNDSDLELSDWDDVIRVEQMPLLCIEIISPSQSSVETLRKFKVYLDLGVKSCWFVDPAIKVMQIYHLRDGTMVGGKVFTATDPLIEDNTLGVSIPSPFSKSSKRGMSQN
jgi:Uma2 family endonuclease